LKLEVFMASYYEHVRKLYPRSPSWWGGVFLVWEAQLRDCREVGYKSHIHRRHDGRRYKVCDEPFGFVRLPDSTFDELARLTPITVAHLSHPGLCKRCKARYDKRGG
jgi:hypothetical protein